jgi:hypothetical protein
MEMTVNEMGTMYDVLLDGTHYRVLRYGDEILKVLDVNFKQIIDDEIIRMISMNMGSIELMVLLVDGKPKGMFPLSRFANYEGPVWWTSTKTVKVPVKDYMDETVNIGNIRSFF